MTTLIVSKNNTCQGTGHFDVHVTGDMVFDGKIGIKESDIIMTEEEKRIFVDVLLRLAKITRTDDQLKLALTLGITVII